MSQRNKTLLVVGGVAVIVALLMWSSDRGSNPDASPSPSGSANGSASPTPGGSVNSVRAQYDALVKEYEGRRIQFDMNCQAIPNALTFKTGTKVMFDNRSGDKRTFSLNGKVYNILGYGWQLITLSSSKLPMTYTIDCGSAQNVGTITIQK
jgi:hypothetical protein